MKALSLFSGIGGIDLAGEWAGIETVAFCERDPYCQKVLKKHWPKVPCFDDVTTLKGEQIGAVDLITGGYPCQPFSTAGKRRGHEDDRHLWPEMFRLVKELRPAWVVGENVAGHISMGLDEVLSDLGAEDYKARPFVFSAAAVGANHRRERCFVVAYSPGARIGGKVGDIRQADGGSRGTLFRKLDGPGADVPNSMQRRLSESESKPFQERPEDRAGFRSRPPGDSWWAVEPNVGRVAHGIPKRVDRLRALGNAVVPQQVYPILKAIKQIHDSTKGIEE